MITRRKIFGLRCMNAAAAIVLLGMLLLFGNDSVFHGMVLKPIAILGLLVAAAWLDERLTDSREPIPARRRSSGEARLRERRRYTRAHSRERRTAQMRAGSAENA